MRRNLWLAALGVTVLLISGQAFGDDTPSGAIVGVDLGAGIPVSDFQRSSEVGGVVAPWAGYRIRWDSLAITPMVRTQFGFFPAKDQDIQFTDDNAPSVGNNRIIRRRIQESDVQSLFAGSGGFRVSLIDGTREIYGGALGGYSTDLGSGPTRGAGPGYTLEAGINLGIAENTALGIFIRRDEAYMAPTFRAEDRDSHTQYLTIGFSLSQFFPRAVAEPPPPPPPPAPAPTPAPKVAKKIVLRGVTFAFDSAKLTDDATPILDAAVSALEEAGDVQVSIEGHTDAIGTEEYNLGLSRRRAASVRTYLEEKGIDGTRLDTVGYGEAQPVATNDTKEGRAQNRRVELKVVE